MAGGGDQQTLVFRLLGEPRILYGMSSLVDLLAQKEQALLIYLACQPGRRFSREHLATLLWGETPESRARYNLRRALWNLRRALDPFDLPLETVLIVESAGIKISASASCYVDAVQFEQGLDLALQELASPGAFTPEAMRRTRWALGLYQGDFLEGFLVRRAPGFEEWHASERERFFVLLIQGLNLLIGGYIEAGDKESAISACQRLLGFDPLHEDTHRLLMRLYWEVGQRPRALRQHHVFRELLRRELGVEPLEETQDLYRRILQYEPPTTHDSPLVPTCRLTPPLPPPEALRRPRLFSLLDRGLTARLTLLSAPSGYGKTTVVAQWLAVRSQSQSRVDLGRPPGELGLLFAWYSVVEADNTASAFVQGLVAALSRLHSTVAQVLRHQVYDYATLPEDPQRLASLLSGALATLAPDSFVLVLDDLHNLTDPQSQMVLRYLLEYLPANGHLYLLTQEDPPLPLARLRIKGRFLEIRTAELRFTDDEATDFLMQAPGLSLTPEEVTELTSQAEGWVAPLWLAANALSRFAASLDDVWEGLFAYLREEVLACLPGEVIRALVRSSILNVLSPNLCEAVLGVPNNAVSCAKWLAGLERRNLFLQRLEGQGRPGEPQYAYHPIFLAFLRTERPNYLSETETLELHQRATKAWEQRAGMEQALHHAEQAGDETVWARLLEEIAPEYLNRNRLDLLSRRLDRLGASALESHPHLEVQAGRLRQMQGRTEEAHRLYRRAAAHFEARQEPADQGDSLLALAELELLRGRYGAGIGWGRDALGTWDCSDAYRSATALSVVGLLEACLGELEAARSSTEEARKRAIAHGDPALTSRVRRDQAWVAFAQGAYHQAMDLCQMAAHKVGQHVSPRTVTSGCDPMPMILREWGESESSWEATQRRLTEAREFHDKRALSRAYVDLGSLHLDRGQFSDAEAALLQARAEGEAAGQDGLVRLHGDMLLVGVRFLQGRSKEAAEVAQGALQRSRMRGASPLETAIAQTGVALANIQSLRFLGGVDQLREAHRAFDRVGARFGVFVTAVLMALAEIWKGSEDQARKYVDKAMALAASEGYVQTAVTFSELSLPVFQFALREGIELLYVIQVLARMGSDVVGPVVEMTEDAAPVVRGRAATALEAIGAREEFRGAAMEALHDLQRDPDLEVRAVAERAGLGLRRLDDSN